MRAVLRLTTTTTISVWVCESVNLFGVRMVRREEKKKQWKWKQKGKRKFNNDTNIYKRREHERLIVQSEEFGLCDVVDYFMNRYAVYRVYMYRKNWCASQASCWSNTRTTFNRVATMSNKTTGWKLTTTTTTAAFYTRMSVLCGGDRCRAMAFNGVGIEYIWNCIGSKPFCLVPLPMRFVFLLKSSINEMTISAHNKNLFEDFTLHRKGETLERIKQHVSFVGWQSLHISLLVMRVANKHFTANATHIQ